MRLMIAQLNMVVGNISGNLKKILNTIEKAKNIECDIVIFPELSITGYPPEDLLLKSHFIKDNIEALETIKSNVRDICVVVGFVDMKGTSIYNAAAIIYNENIKAIYHKSALPNYGVFDEKRYFKSGEGNTFIIGIGKHRIGINICEDIWVDDSTYKKQSELGADIIINISASPYHHKKGSERSNLMLRRAREINAIVVYANLVGGQDELVFDGHSIIASPDGILAQGKQFEEDLIIYDITENYIKKSSYDDANVIYVKDTKDKRVEIPNRRNIKILGEYEEIYKALVLGVRDYIQKNGFKKVVIGLSGGIDSSLVALIACDALGKDNVVGISMPTRFSSDGTKSDARKLAENLGIEFYEIPIQGIFDTYLNTIEGYFKGKKWDITEENIQARIRGNILMAFSNKFGWIVLTTGNKSEMSCGYATLYGDMAGGFAVIKDVYKTMVYKLAEYRNSIAGYDIIPQSIIDRPPSAELRDNQKDEDTLPPYDILDNILKDYIEKDKSFDELKKDHDPDIVKKVISMVDRNEYKRRQAPPGIKITPKAFGRDRRLPIVNKYREF